LLIKSVLTVVHPVFSPYKTTTILKKQKGKKKPRKPARAEARRNGINGNDQGLWVYAGNSLPKHVRVKQAG